MNAFKNFFHNYLSLPIKKYRNLYAQVKSIPAYSIQYVNFVNGVHNLLIYINGTGKAAPYFLHEIASDNLFLDQFSIEDIRTILGLYFEELKKPQYTIVGQKFSSEGNDILCFKNRSSNQIEHFTVVEILAKKDTLLRQLSPEDAYRVGYLSSLSTTKKDNPNI